MEEGTSITAGALLFLMAMAFMTLSLRRKYAIVPLFTTACLMPMGQMVVVGAFHFHVFRIVLLMAVIRLLVRGEMGGWRVRPLDRVFFVWVGVCIFVGIMAKPSGERLTNLLGEAYNAICTFVFLRCVLRDEEDVIRSVRVLAILAAPVALLLIIEELTSRNMLSVFGGVPEITVARDGRLRCQGAFRHPILTGTFGATLFPLCIGLFAKGWSHRRVAVSGAISCLVIVLASASSGPLLALLFGGLGLGLWKFRRHMRTLRWSVLLVLGLLAIVMNAPVYYLIARISQITGGTGWHRSYLIETAIDHFGEWWMCGTAYTAHWGPAGEVIVADPNHMDITNHFIMEGVRGGMLRLGLFVAMIACCFRIVGRQVKSGASLNMQGAFFIWTLGVSLFSHCVSFISVPYFDQIIVFWYGLLAAIAAVATVDYPRKVIREEVPDEEWERDPMCV